MLRIRPALLAALMAACAPSTSSAPSPSSADLLIRGGTVYDGSGGTPYSADVVIAGDSIVAIDRGRRSAARDTLDASGLAVAPGFINMLSWGYDELLQDGRGESDLRQGVTLEIFGEGQSPPAPFTHADTGWPLKAYHQQASCRDCHTAAPYAARGDNCKACHTSSFATDRFDHAVTGLILDDTHRAFDCQNCHADGEFLTPPACADCHEPDEGITYPARRPGHAAPRAP